MLLTARPYAAFKERNLLNRPAVLKTQSSSLQASEIISLLVLPQLSSQPEMWLRVTDD